MSKETKLEPKEWLFILGTLLSGGIAWGTMTTRISNLDNRYSSLSSIPQTLATLTERITNIDKRTADMQIDYREIRKLLMDDRRARLNNRLP